MSTAGLVSTRSRVGAWATTGETCTGPPSSSLQAQTGAGTTTDTNGTCGSAATSLTRHISRRFRGLRGNGGFLPATITARQCSLETPTLVQSFPGSSSAPGLEGVSPPTRPWVRSIARSPPRPRPVLRVPRGDNRFCAVDVGHRSPPPRRLRVPPGRGEVDPANPFCWKLSHLELPRTQ